MIVSGSSCRARGFYVLLREEEPLGPCPETHALELVFPFSQATCERGFAAMEESHQKVIDELQRKHQRELENLQEEKERLLAEETAATIAGKSICKKKL